MREPLEVVRAFLSERSKIPLEELSGNTKVFASGTFRSLVILELIVHVERTFGIEIDPKELVPANFHDIRTIADLVGRMIAGPTAAGAASVAQ